MREIYTLREREKFVFFYFEVYFTHTNIEREREYFGLVCSIHNSVFFTLCIRCVCVCLHYGQQKKNVCLNHHIMFESQTTKYIKYA